MWTYIIIFAISTGFIYISELIDYKVVDKSKKLFSNSFRMLGVLTPAVLAGVRSFQVGTDINVYGNRIFQSSLNSDELRSFIYDNPYFVSHYEKGYLALNYVISRFTDDSHMYYFILNLIFVTIAYYSIKILDSHLSVTFSWSLFLFTTWLFSLNILRQSIAMTISFLCISLLLKNKAFEGVVCAVIAVFFHDSAVILSMIIPMIILLSKGNQMTKFQKRLILFIPIMFILSFGIITSYAATVPKFARHLISHAGYEFSTSLFIGFIIFLLPFLYPIFKDKNLINNNYVSIFILFLFLGAVFAGMGGYNYVIFGRMAYYFQFSIFLGVPCIYQVLRNKKALRVRKTTFELIIIKILLFIATGLNFYAVFYNGNYGDLFPFIFK